MFLGRSIRPYSQTVEPKKKTVILPGVGPENCLFCPVRIGNLLLENGRSNLKLSARYSITTF